MPLSGKMIGLSQGIASLCRGDFYMTRQKLKQIKDRWNSEAMKGMSSNPGDYFRSGLEVGDLLKYIDKLHSLLKKNDIDNTLLEPNEVKE